MTSPEQTEKELRQRIYELERALKVIHTWASVEGALDPQHVRTCAMKAIKGKK